MCQAQNKGARAVETSSIRGKIRRQYYRHGIGGFKVCLCSWLLDSNITDLENMYSPLTHKIQGGELIRD